MAEDRPAGIPKKDKRRRSVSRSSTTREIVWNQGVKYERPVMPRAVTLATHRCIAGFRQGGIVTR